ncbi:hypothetical protein [Streptomyces boncukensis]|uniref:Uncharacterized protein n=1 Tax=Streptomyces boncukensis TaxID=2711219 RepID=A0A6G4X9T3_9ACTN|nr:hypothetical protein [Streptomyces boncukensis]NGO73597.1 hypothetical protein [Streptomyces boncukensis]
MKYLSTLIASLVGLGAAAYLVVYLYRWEWQRALISGMLLLAIEGFLIGMLMLLRLDRLERRLQDSDSRLDDVRRHLHGTGVANPQRPPFAWLDATVRRGRTDLADRTYVFIPVLVVAGAALSGVAWIVQKIAQMTSGGAERRLAGRLVHLTAPPPSSGPDAPGGLSGTSLENRPAVAPRRRARLLVGLLAAVLVALLSAFGIDRLADATQTRPQDRPDAAATTVVFRVTVKRGDASGHAVELAAAGLWEQCRTATSVRLEKAPLSRLSENVYAGVVRPGLSPHDQMRLRGCLADARQDRASAEVLGQGDADRS